MFLLLNVFSVLEGSLMDFNLFAVLLISVGFGRYCWICVRTHYYELLIYTSFKGPIAVSGWLTDLKVLRQEPQYSFVMYRE